MKHVVELQYTNPSHEHVSLRRRVETVNRVVEAQSEEEALNRAANQQRALGFRIQSANIIEQVEETSSEILSEDVELEEGKVAKALAVGAMSLASMGAKAHTDTTKSVAQLAHERPALAQRLHDIGASGQVPASDKRAAELQRKQDQEMPASERRAKELKKEEIEIDEAKKPLKPTYWRAEWRLGTQTEVDKNNKKIYDRLAKTDPAKATAFHDNLMKMKKKDVKEETGADKRVAGYKMPAHIKAAQAKSDALSKVEKPVQAGTLAAFKRREMKKEEVEQVDEANMRFDYEAAARPKSSDVKNFLNRDKNPRAAAASKKYIRRMTKLGGLGPNQTKKDTEAHMKAHFEEVEQVDEAAKTKKEKLKALLYRDRSNVRELGKGAGLTDAQKAAARKAIANEEVELDEGSKRMSAAVKLQRAFDREKTASDASRKRGEEVLAQARAEYAKKQVAKTNEEAEQVDESLLKGLKRAQVKWNTAHRAVYGKDPSAKSMMIGAIARLAGAKAHTARSVSTQIAGKPVTAQQQAAAKARAGKANMAKMRNEAKETADSNDVNAGVKGKKAAERMTKKAAEIRKTKIEGSVNKINMEPTIDLNKKAEK